MRYEGTLYRPPSEGNSLILQATIGCSWNKCTYCEMYTAKTYRERPVADCLEDLDQASAVYGEEVSKLFVADGDALGMALPTWHAVLDAADEMFPNLRRVSCYATAINLLAMEQADLDELRRRGLTRLYIGPESGDDPTMKRIAKGAGFDDHVEAARKAKAAGMEISMIALLGAGGVERSAEHAAATARLITAMDPEFFAALTLTVRPGTPLHRLQERGRFTLPDKRTLLGELRTMVDEAMPTDALFRTNHASNHLPLAGRLPEDAARIVATIDGALAGRVGLRPEWRRGL